MLEFLADPAKLSGFFHAPMIPSLDESAAKRPEVFDIYLQADRGVCNVKKNIVRDDRLTMSSPEGIS